jgi:hypothetical protein
VGSYGAGGGSLARKSPEEVQRELGLSQTRLERWLPGLRVFSFALPDAALPSSAELLVKGEHDGMYYGYGAVVGAGRGLARAPQTAQFDPHRIPRFDVTDAELDHWLAVADRPGMAYVSAGE